MIEYPPAKRDPTVDRIHGIDIPDPYRWLEDVDSEDTKTWVEAQNSLTFSFLENIESREYLRDRISELWSFDKYDAPVRRGERYFYMHKSGIQNQGVLYRMDGLQGDPVVLLDPNGLSTDGTIALSGWAVSKDGSLLAYGLAVAGSDWQEWRVRDVDTGEDLDDRIEWVKFSGASWAVDNGGFYYSRYDAPASGDELKGTNYYHKLYYHRIGTPQNQDQLVYERPDEKEWGFGASVTEDGHYLIVLVWRGTLTENGIFYLDLRDDSSEIVELLPDFDGEYDFLGNDGTVFFLKTDYEAPLSRIIGIDLSRPGRGYWKEIVPEAGDALVAAKIVAGRFVAEYLHDAHSILKLFSLDGTPEGEIPLPGLGSVGAVSGRVDDQDAFFSYTSFAVPGTVYRYSFADGSCSVFRKPELKFHPEDYITEQVFVESKDGAQIPLFITRHRNTEIHTSTPAFLYGYGGFNIPLGPSFSISNLVWMEAGGIFAQGSLRGGGEYGRSWHEAGIKLNKQNVFDDFIASAEWLIDNGYTSRKRLCIGGASNGGLLVGACMTQRPDLFAVCLPAVGVLDMLRFHKFTIGWAWTSDYGSPENADEFGALHAYSPYHNVREGERYPATLITTGDHDDRVFPAHSFKFTAALQAAHAGDSPVLARIETKAGHGFGKPTAKIIAEAADRWAFTTYIMNLTIRGQKE